MDIHDYKAFLFDLDGVLVDSEREYTRIWNLINEEFPTGVEDFARKIKGTTLESILDTYYPDPEVRKNVERRLYEEEARMRYYYCPGAEEFLQYLQTQGIPCAIYTSSNHLKMEHLYRDIPDIKQYFKAIVTGDDVTASKPDPEGYILAARRLGVDPKEAVVVEDSLQGVKAGRAAGGGVIGVAGTLPPVTLAPYSNVVVENLTSLITPH